MVDKSRPEVLFGVPFKTPDLDWGGGSVKVNKKINSLFKKMFD